MAKEAKKSGDSQGVDFNNLEPDAYYDAKLTRVIQVGPRVWRPDEKHLVRGELLSRLVDENKGAFDSAGTEKAG